MKASATVGNASIDDLLAMEPPTEKLSIQQTLTEDYRLICRIFMRSSNGETGDPRMEKDTMWQLLDDSQLPSAFPHFSRAEFDRIFSALPSGLTQGSPHQSGWLRSHA